MGGGRLEIFCKKISGKDAYKGPESIIYLLILREIKILEWKYPLENPFSGANYVIEKIQK